KSDPGHVLRKTRSNRCYFKRIVGPYLPCVTQQENIGLCENPIDYDLCELLRRTNIRKVPRSFLLWNRSEQVLVRIENIDAEHIYRNRCLHVFQNSFNRLTPGNVWRKAIPGASVVRVAH